MQVNVHSIVIVRKGYIVAEQYYSDDYGPEDLHRIYSCTKSINSALLGITIEQGYLSGVNEKMIDFFPEYEIENLTDDKRNITLEHLLTMSSGLEWYEMEYPNGDNRNNLRKWDDNGGRVKFVKDKPNVAQTVENFA